MVLHRWAAPFASNRGVTQRTWFGGWGSGLEGGKFLNKKNWARVLTQPSCSQRPTNLGECLLFERQPQSDQSAAGCFSSEGQARKPCTLCAAQRLLVPDGLPGCCLGREHRALGHSGVCEGNQSLFAGPGSELLVMSQQWTQARQLHHLVPGARPRPGKADDLIDRPLSGLVSGNNNKKNGPHWRSCCALRRRATWQR